MYVTTVQDGHTDWAYVFVPQECFEVFTTVPATALNKGQTKVLVFGGAKMHWRSVHLKLGFER